jgi:hypothetical protein
MGGIHKPLPSFAVPSGSLYDDTLFSFAFMGHNKGHTIVNTDVMKANK